MNSKMQQILQLSKRTRWLVVFNQASVFALLFVELNVFLVAIMALLLLWQILSIATQRSLPAQWLVQVIACLCCIILAFMGFQLGLLLAMIHLMCFAFVLQGLSLTRRRDLYLFVLQNVFLLAAILIFEQSIPIVLVVLVAFSLCLTLLTAALQSEAVVVIAPWLNVKLILISLPLAILLFVFFPRLTPFWQVPNPNSAKTGLSDIVQPGDIARLAHSDALAFRVSFLGDVPDYSSRYWRALVLDEYNGRRWLRSIKNKQQEAESIKYGAANLAKVNQEVEYQIIAQPSYQPWLYALSRSNSTTIGVVRLADNRLVKKQVITQPFSYKVQSQISNNKGFMPLTAEERELYLGFPPASNPLLQQLALHFMSQLRSIHNADEKTKQFIKLTFEHMRGNAFQYTLQPPLLNENSLDEFFFETRAGFCVHFASSVAFLMRAAAVPTRLVTGYLGGEYNPQGDYFALYQYDAHAWLEYWTDGDGWQRLDPTIVAIPERMQAGYSADLASEQQTFLARLTRFKQWPMLQYIQQQIEALDYQWTKWVINYSQNQQNDLLKRLFGHNYQWKNSLLIALSLIISLFLLWFWQHRRQVKPLLINQYWQQLKNTAKKYHVSFVNGVTVAHLCQSISDKYPQFQQECLEINALFSALLYQENTVINQTANKKKIKQLKVAIKQLQTKLKRHG